MGQSLGAPFCLAIPGTLPFYLFVNTLPEYLCYLVIIQTRSDFGCKQAYVSYRIMPPASLSGILREERMHHAVQIILIRRALRKATKTEDVFKLVESFLPQHFWTLKAEGWIGEILAL
jgi:hypothetical protein